MRGLVVLSLIFSLVCLAPTYAVGPEDDPVPAPPSVLDGPALSNGQVMMEDGPVATVLPVTAGPHHMAYRGMRAAQNDCNCCGEYFGGFGPLWETYCADKKCGCWGATAACGSPRCYPSFRSCFGLSARCRCTPIFTGCRWQMMRARLCNIGCRKVTSCDYGCDCAEPVMTDPVAPMPEEADQPVEPTPVEPAPVQMVPVEPAPVEPAPIEPAPIEPAPIEPAQPDPALQPEPAPPAAPPAPAEPVPTSARRGWGQYFGRSR